MILCGGRGSGGANPAPFLSANNSSSGLPSVNSDDFPARFNSRRVTDEKSTVELFKKMHNADTKEKRMLDFVYKVWYNRHK